MDPAALAALRTPEGLSALSAAAAVAGGDPLAAASALRAHGIAPDLAAAALTQSVLRARAIGKFGADATRMWFTRAGLEQATRRVVADRRAARLVTAGVTHIADLGCGIGADTIAFARAGIRVTAVDADATTASVAAANVAALGFEDLVSVRTAAAESIDLEHVGAAFCDPARRRASGRVFDPDAYSPPWTFVVSLANAVPATVLKLAPGIDHALVPAAAEAEWVSVDGDVVEAALWCGPLGGVPRRATLLSGSGQASAEVTLVGSGTAVAPVGPIGGYVYDPDGAVVRSHLVAEFATTVDGRLGDASIAYVYTDTYVASPFGRAYEIHDVMPFSLKRLRAALRERGIGRLTIKKRGSPLEPEQLRRDLRLHGSGELTIILTHVAGAPTVLLCSPS
jgi:SAM-dependent methyltransferase